MNLRATIESDLNKEGRTIKLKFFYYHTIIN